MLKYDSFRPIVKYAITFCTPKIIIKKICFFFIKYKNEWKERKFWRQRDLKKWLLQKQKSNQDRRHWCQWNISFKEEPYGTKIHLNTLLNTMIIMLLDHYE